MSLLAIQNKIDTTEKVPIVPELSPKEDRIKSKLILKKQFVMLSNGIDRKHFKIFNFKLFVMAKKCKYLDYNP